MHWNKRATTGILKMSISVPARTPLGAEPRCLRELCVHGPRPRCVSVEYVHRLVHGAQTQPSVLQWGYLGSRRVARSPGPTPLRQFLRRGPGLRVEGRWGVASRMWLSESQSPSLHIRSCPLSSLSLSCSSPRACYRDNGCSSRAHPTGTLRAPGLQSPSAPPLCPEEQTALLPQGLCTSSSYCLSRRVKRGSSGLWPPPWSWQLGVQGETCSKAMMGRWHRTDQAGASPGLRREQHTAGPRPTLKASRPCSPPPRSSTARGRGWAPAAPSPESPLAACREIIFQDAASAWDLCATAAHSKDGPSGSSLWA